MSVTFYLIQLPSVLLLVFLICSLALFGYLGTWFFKKYIKINVLNAHNEATGMIFSIVGGLYGLLLAFVVFLVWDQFNAAQKNADVEGSMAKALYRNIRYYPDTAATSKLSKAYARYIDNVILIEYPLMEENKASSETVKSFSKLYEELESLNVTNSGSRVDMMFEQVNELAICRNLRHLDGSSEISFIIWLPILLGGFITFLFATMLHVESLTYHMKINGLLGVFIGLIMFLIIIMDHPFTGDMRIQPRAYLQIREMLEMEKDQ